MELSAAHQRLLLDLARAAIRAALSGQPHPAAQSDDPGLMIPAGSFVSLHEVGTHRLRGCVGRLQTDEPLVKTIVDVAANVLEDPRFIDKPVTVEELRRLELEISVLSPLKTALHPLDFDPRTEGIYLKCAGRTGTFLPQVARQTGWTREELLSRLCAEKMGLPGEMWRNPETTLLTYTVLLIGPVPFVGEREPVAGDVTRGQP